MRTRALIAILLALALTATGWAATKSRAKTKAKAKAKPAAKAAVKKAAPVATKQSAHFTLRSDLPQATADAILTVCEASLDSYAEVFGLTLYPNPNPGDKRTVVIAMKGKGTSGFAAHWDQKPAELQLGAVPARELSAAVPFSAQEVFRLAREFAYPVAAYDNDAFNQGLMDYLGAHVVDAVAAKLDNAKVVRPDDLVEVGGSGQFARWEQRAEPGTATAAAMLVYRVANAHGKDTVGKALRLVAMSDDPKWQAGPGSGVHPRTYKVAALCQQLIDMTDDGEIAEWFKESHFPSVVDPVNVTAAELWSYTDETKRCNLLCERWGSGTMGVLDGQQVVLLTRFAQKATLGSEPRPLIFGSLVFEAVPGAAGSVWLQPATNRLYVAGKVKLKTTGAVIENQALDAQGQPLRLEAPAK